MIQNMKTRRKKIVKLYAFVRFFFCFFVLSTSVFFFVGNSI